MTPLELKDKLCEAIKAHGKGEAGEDVLFAAADAYIESLKEYKKKTGNKFRLPSRGYIIRAFR